MDYSLQDNGIDINVEGDQIKSSSLERHTFDDDYEYMQDDEVDGVVDVAKIEIDEEKDDKERSGQSSVRPKRNVYISKRFLEGLQTQHVQVDQIQMKEKKQ